VTIYYVNKSGDDANGGTNATTDAKLTIKSGVPLCSDGDTLKVGSGVYEEDTIPWTGYSGVTVEGDRNVIIDGGGANIFSQSAIEMADYFTIKNVRFRDCSYAVYYSGEFTTRISFERCWFEACRYATGGSQSNNNQRRYVKAHECVLIGLVHLCTYGSTGSPIFYMTNNLFYDFSGEVYYSVTGDSYIGLALHKGNIYHTIGGAQGLWDQADANANGMGSALSIGDNYYYNFAGNFFKWKNIVYATLADFKAAFPGYEAGSYEGVDPLLADIPNGIYYPRADSPVVGPGTYVEKVGPWARVLNFSDGQQFFGTWDIVSSPAADAGTAWARTAGSVSKVGTTFLGNGTIVSPVIPLAGGSVVRLTRVMLRSKESYPLDVIDYDNSDSAPNRKNYRYRISDTPFNQDGTGGGPTWSSYEIEEELVGQTGAYVQLELTFRIDGVAA